MAEQARNASLTAAGSRSSSTTARSWSSILEWIDWTALSPETKGTLERIGPFLAVGLSYREIGEQTGETPDRVRARVTQVKDELILHVRERAPGLVAGLEARLEEARSLTAPDAAGASTPTRRTDGPAGASPTGARPAKAA